MGVASHRLRGWCGGISRLNGLAPVAMFRSHAGLCANEACTVSGGDVTLFTDRAGLKIAHIECQTCGKKWKRVGE